MNTTSLIVEMIIIGLQAAIWLALAVALTWGFDVQAFDRISDFATPLTLVGVALCYTIGVVVDALTAWLEDLIPWRLLNRGSKESKEERAHRRAQRRAMKQELRLSDKELYADLNKDQYFLRLMRSTAFNILIISILGSWLLVESGHAWQYSFILALVAFVALYGWLRRRRGFISDRNAFYEVLKQHQKASSKRKGMPVGP